MKVYVVLVHLYHQPSKVFNVYSSKEEVIKDIREHYFAGLFKEDTEGDYEWVRSGELYALIRNETELNFTMQEFYVAESGE